MTLTRRRTLATLAGGIAVPLCSPFLRPARAASGTVNIYNWADYIGETTIADFEAETGISVVYDLYASSEEMQAKMLVGGTGYDVVLQSAMTLPQLVKAGVYQKNDRTVLKNWGNLDPQILKICGNYDPGNAYGVPYMWGSVGMTYNLEMVKAVLPDADLESLDMILKPENAAKLAECGLTVLDSPTDFGFMVLKYLGLDPNTAGPEDYAKMVEAIAPIRQYITNFDNTNYLTTLPNGEICGAATWSGDYGVAKTRAAEAGIDIDLAYFVPKTGAPAWFDVWAVPSDAQNLANAHLFLDYMLRPEVVAACTDFIGYANANTAATPLVSPEIAKDPAVYPDAATLARLFTTTPQTDAQERDINRAWQTIKTGG